MCVSVLGPVWWAADTLLVSGAPSVCGTWMPASVTLCTPGLAFSLVNVDESSAVSSVASVMGSV